MSHTLDNYYLTSQNRIIDLFCFVMLLDIHTFFANAVGRLIFGVTPIDTIIVYAILIFFVFRAFIDVIKKIDIRCMFAFIILILFMTVSLLVNSKLTASEYSGVIKTAYLSVFSGLFLGSAVTDFKLLEEKLCKLSSIVAVEMIVSFFIYHFVFHTVWGSGAMGLSYLLLVASVLLLYRLFKKFEVKYLILSVALIAIMVLQGSRGPLISLICFAAIYQFINISKNRKKVLRNMAVLVLLSVLFIVYLPNILQWIANVSDKFGFQSKFLKVMLEGDFFTPNGRDIVADGAIDIIQNNPFGNGLFGERPVLGTYCHNIFLEFLVDFGVIFGSIICITYVVLIFKKFRTNNMPERNVMNILFCAFLIKLFFSGSFWTETVFFAFLAFLIKPHYNIEQNNIVQANEKITVEGGNELISDETSSYC